MTDNLHSNIREATRRPERSPAQRRSLTVILAIALVTRVLAVWNFVATHPRTWLFTHPYEMGLVANSLIHGHGYGSPFGGSTGPTAIVAPGYPTLVAAVFLIFGSATFASALVIMGLQIVISLLAIWLMMHIAWEMLDSKTATLAGAFWAVSLPLLWIPTICWETSISEFSLVAMIALAIRCQREPTRTSWIVMGACCGIIALINPALLPTLVAMMGWIAWQTRPFARTWPVAGALALVLVFAAWPIRNAVRFHAFIPLRTTVGFEMWMGNRPGASGRLDDSLFPMFNKQELDSYLAQGEVAYTNGKSRQAWTYIRAQPATFLKLSARRAFRFWTGTGNLDGPGVYAMHALITSVFGLIGLALLYRRGMRSFAALMALPLLLFPLPYYITHAEFRYRLNIDPVLTILAAFAVTQLAVAWSQRSANRT